MTDDQFADNSSLPKLWQFHFRSLGVMRFRTVRPMPCVSVHIFVGCL